MLSASLRWHRRDRSLYQLEQRLLHALSRNITGNGRIIRFPRNLIDFININYSLLGFFGVDVLLVYIAFKLNYRSGRLYETVDVTPAKFSWTRVHPSGRQEQFDCNPYWARLNFREWPDGRTALSIAAEGKELAFARFLTDDERRDLASALREALLAARGGVRI